MKKYLFLLLLFILYLFLFFKENTKNVISYDSDVKTSVVNVEIYFINGINSNKLLNEFKNYKDEYLVKRISLNNKSYNFNCDIIVKCINDIYLKNNIEFYNKHIVSGFRIDNINIIANKDYIINYLKNKDYLYRIY